MSKLIPLFSGSKGNSYYIGSRGSGILIDAGRSCKQIETAMLERGLDPKRVEAVFVTHEHTDHCTALKVFTSKYRTPVYASLGTLKKLELDDRISPRADSMVIEDKVALSTMSVERFDTMHDAAESCCYRVTMPDGRMITVATDLGVITDTISKAVGESDVAVIESNHDINMLRNGSYPYVLKRRILSDKGHLSNEACSSALAGFIRNNTTRIILGHLSRENNTPELAFQTALCALTMEKMRENIDFTLTVAGETGGQSVIF